MHRAIDIVDVAHLPTVTHQQIEADVFVTAGRDLPAVVGSRLVTGQEGARQLAAGARLVGILRGIADIGDGGETAGLCDTQPGATGELVPPGENSGRPRALPVTGIQGRTGMKFIAIGGDN